MGAVTAVSGKCVYCVSLATAGGIDLNGPPPFPADIAQLARHLPFGGAFYFIFFTQGWL